MIGPQDKKPIDTDSFLSVSIGFLSVGQFLEPLRSDTPSLTSNPPFVNRFPLHLPTTFHPHPHNPVVVRACAGRSLLFVESASVESARRPRGWSRPSGLAAPEPLRGGPDTDEHPFSGRYNRR